jgi:hypothetical protein
VGQYDCCYPAYTSIEVSFLEATNQYALWIGPSYSTNEAAHWTIPMHVTWLAANQGVLRSSTVLSEKNHWERSPGQRLFDLVVPPGFYGALVLILGKQAWENFPWKDFWTGLICAVVYAAVGVGIGRRYHFTAGSQIKWAVSNLCFGLPGLFAFICAEEWPARETCPNCKKLRVVDRENCEYCKAEFAPPAKNGTEIFETVGGGQP